MLTQERVKQIFNYDPITGIFTYKVQRGTRGYVGAVAGFIEDNGYMRLTIDYKRYPAQNVAWLYMYGEYPGLLDHKDTNRSNNAIDNLRPATQTENACNRSLMSNNTSGFKGVYFDKRTGKWRGAVTVHGVKCMVGSWSTAELAAQAVEAKRLELHGEFART